MVRWVVILNTIVRQSSSHLLHSELSGDVVWGGARTPTAEASTAHAWLVGVAAVVGGRGGVMVTVVVRTSPFDFQ